MQSLSIKSSSDRLRMYLPDGKKSTTSTARPSMMTTVEKFRQMRPRIPKPVIHPLVGKQLLIGNATALSSRDELLSSPEGSTLKMGPDDTDVYITSPTNMSKEDDIVESNLLRLSQSTCSITNIDGKTRTNKECLELKTKSIQSLRSTLCKQKCRLFLPFHDTLSPSSSLNYHDPIETISRNLQSQGSSAVAFPIIYYDDVWRRDVHYTDQDIDEEERDYKNVIAKKRPESKEHRRCFKRADNNRERSRDFSNRPQTFSKMKIHNGKRIPYSQSTPKKRKDTDLMSRISNILFSYNNSPTVEHVKMGMPSLDGRFTEYIHGVIQLLPDRSYRASSKNGIVNVHGIEDESDAETPDNTDTRATNILQNTSMLHGAVYNHVTAGFAGKVNSHSIPVPSVPQRQKLLPVTNKESNLTEMNECVDETETHKKHIIVDMPKIIFNDASSCQNLDESIDERQDESQQSNGIQSPLRKVVHQQQVRIKELTNLLEDVKELSLKTEAPKLQSAT